MDDRITTTKCTEIGGESFCLDAWKRRDEKESCYAGKKGDISLMIMGRDGWKLALAKAAMAGCESHSSFSWDFIGLFLGWKP